MSKESSEVTILQIWNREHLIEVTDKHLKIKSSPLPASLALMISSINKSIASPYGRGVLWTTRVEQIPLKSIASLAVEENKLRINWIDRRSGRIKRLELKVKKYKANLIKEAILKVLKGENPLKLATEYSKKYPRYLEVLEDEESIVIVKGDHIEIHNPELFKIATGALPLIAPNPAMLQMTDFYADKIPIDSILDAKLEVKEGRGRKYVVKIKTNSGEKRVIFRSRERAENLIELINKITSLSRTEDREQIVRRVALENYIPQTADWKKNLLEDLSKLLMLFMIFYIAASELVGKGLLTLILGLTAALAILLVWKHARG